MLCHKMSLRITRKNSRYWRRSRHQFINILMLSIMLTMLFTEIMARPNLEALLLNKPRNDELEQQRPPDLFLDELVTNTNGERLFNKLKKYHHSQSNFLSKWPGLRDLVFTLDYDDDNSLDDSNELLNMKFIERLRQLANSKSDVYDDDIRNDSDVANLTPSESVKTPVSLSANQLSLKDHNVKKNVQFHKQYMSPCHFKICNMGRKRYDRFVRNY